MGLNWFENNTEPLPQVTPQIPAVGLQADSLKSFPSLRTEINLTEPIPFRVIPERFRQPIYRPTPPPPQLSPQDSLTLNLKGKSDVSLNWELEFNTRFNESAHSIIQPDLLETDTDTITLIETGDTLTAKQIVTRPPESTQYTEQPDDTSRDLIEKPPLQQDWFLAILVISVMTTGIVRINWFRYLKDIIQSVLFSSIVNKLSGYNASHFRPSLILGALFYFNTSVFVYEILTETGREFMGYDGVLSLLLIFLFLFVLFSAKIIVYRIMGFVFGTSKEIAEYNINSSATSKAYGVLLLPVILFIPFVDHGISLILINAGITLFIILYLMQIARGIRSNLSDAISGYYIILYLCALEILPLGILFKVLFK